jgi:hypothetical protein
MSTIKDTIFYILANNVAVAAMVAEPSPSTVKRIYPLRTPDNPTFPAITFMRIGKDSSIGDRLDGASDLVGELYSVDIMCPKKGASTPFQPGSEMVEELAKKVKTAMNGFKGTILGIDIQKISLENESDRWEPDLELYRVSQQYRIFHREG